MKHIGWFLFILLAVGIGLYPISYWILGTDHGVLKDRALYNESIWKWMFFQHITFGGIAMLCGFSQFSKKLRDRYLNFHRTLGKIYVVAVVLGGLAGFYVALYTFGGLTAQLGFVGLASAWLISTITAYLAIRRRNQVTHERWMIRSYALTWAAVTLRIYLPAFEHGLGMDFNESYPIIAWLCWVPNLIVAELIIRNKNKALKQVVN